VPFTFDDAYIARVRERLPELPDARRERYIRDFGLPAHDAAVLAGDLDLGTYFEAAAEAAGPGLSRAIANWVLGDFSAHMNADGLLPIDSSVGPNKLARLAQLVDGGTISGKQAKTVFAEMVATGEKPKQIIERLGMQQVSDTGAIEAIVDRVLAANPKEVEGYRGGKLGLMGFFVGAVMREMGGQGNPAVVNEVLKAKLGG
jgi:aspartyl-tRNA(Asn)/glutamyl-tRNA(Gln) amidotransferase subunit B